jgi:hypothetical protein
VTAPVIPDGWYTGADAAAKLGKTIAEIDAMAASGELAAAYFGWMLLVSVPDPPPPTGVDEVQHIVRTGKKGSFLLEFNGAWTAPIAWNATSGQVQLALEQLPTIGYGNVVVQGNPPPNEGDVTFQGALAATDVPQMGVNDAGLKPQGSCVVTKVTPGSPTRRKTTGKRREHPRSR